MILDVKTECAFGFWKHVDELLGDRNLIDLASGTGLNYGTLKNQRSANRLPKATYIKSIADYLNTTTTFLLSDKQKESCSPEMAFVRDNPLCRKIVRFLMEDERLLEVVGAFVESAYEREKEKERKQG